MDEASLGNQKDIKNFVTMVVASISHSVDSKYNDLIFSANKGQTQFDVLLASLCLPESSFGYKNLEWDISRTTWCIAVSDGSFLHFSRSFIYDWLCLYFRGKICSIDKCSQFNNLVYNLGDVVLLDTPEEGKENT